MDWIHDARSLAKILVLPPAGPILVALAGLALAKRAPRLGRVLAWSGLGTLLLLSLPIVAASLLRGFERPPFEAATASAAQAIVILGGGTRRAAPEYDGDTMGRLTFERVRYGARVAKITGLPVLVTGGTPRYASRSEAELMREALVDEYGVPVRWVEAAARNTRENAQRSAALLARDGVRTVVLVAHAADMPRTMREFADAGIVTVPAATGLAGQGPVVPLDFMPSMDALYASHHAIYELLAHVELALLASSPAATSAPSR